MQNAIKEGLHYKLLKNLELQNELDTMDILKVSSLQEIQYIYFLCRQKVGQPSISTPAGILLFGSG